MNTESSHDHAAGSLEREARAELVRRAVGHALEAADWIECRSIVGEIRAVVALHLDAGPPTISITARYRHGGDGKTMVYTAMPVHVGIDRPRRAFGRAAGRVVDQLEKFRRGLVTVYHRGSTLSADDWGAEWRTEPEVPPAESLRRMAENARRSQQPWE